MIFITSSGEIFLLLFHCQFFLVHFTIYIYNSAAGLFLVFALFLFQGFVFLCDRVS